MSSKSYLKDLKGIKEQFLNLPILSDTAPLRNRLIALLISTEGEDSPHLNFVQSLTFKHTGTLVYYGQSYPEEAWSKDMNSLVDYINNLIIACEYKIKYPKPLEYTSKMTVPWLLTNLPLKTLVFLLFVLIIVYGTGVKYHQPTTRVADNILQQLEKLTATQSQENKKETTD